MTEATTPTVRPKHLSGGLSIYETLNMELRRVIIRVYDLAGVRAISLLIPAGPERYIITTGHAMSRPVVKHEKLAVAFQPHPVSFVRGDTRTFVSFYQSRKDDVVRDWCMVVDIEHDHVISKSIGRTIRRTWVAIEKAGAP